MRNNFISHGGVVLRQGTNDFSLTFLLRKVFQLGLRMVKENDFPTQPKLFVLSGICFFNEHHRIFLRAHEDLERCAVFQGSTLEISSSFFFLVSQRIPMGALPGLHNILDLGQCKGNSIEFNKDLLITVCHYCPGNQGYRGEQGCYRPCSLGAHIKYLVIYFSHCSFEMGYEEEVRGEIYRLSQLLKLRSAG